MLLASGATDRAVLVEVDAFAAMLARRNIDANGLADRAEVRCGSVAEDALIDPGAARLVVCNPPYTAPGRGRSARGSRGVARTGNLATFVRAARRAVAARGRAFFSYPAPELPRLLEALGEAGLHAKALRFVHATSDRPARLALISAQPGRPGGLEILPPLVEWAAPGEPSAEAKVALEGP